MDSWSPLRQCVPGAAPLQSGVTSLTFSHPLLKAITGSVLGLGFAAAAVQTLPPGAYVAMNGRVFDPYHVRKDRERNRFEPVTPSA